MYKFLIFFSILVLMLGCSTEKEDVDKIIIYGTPSGNESQQLSYEVTNSLNSDSDISITQKSGTKAYITIMDAHNFEIILPNVIEEESITLDIKVAGIEDSKELHITVLPITLPVLSSPPEPNVFSSSNISKHKNKVFDPQGIPVFERAGNFFYYPVPIAAYSYDLYNNYYKTGDPEVLNKFLSNAIWLRDNCVYTDYGFCSYRSYFPISAYKLDTDWTSAMAQGQAITSLIAAHYITGDESFATVAFDALSAYIYPLEVKGLTADFDGVPWYEEYGSTEMPAHVLNGFLFSLSGVRSFSKSYGTELATRVFDRGIHSLEKNIHKFDLGFTSRYDFSPLNQIASTKGTPPDAYHELHIFQLGWVYSLTGSEVIKEYTEKFLKYDMGGIHSAYRLKEVSKAIKSITANHTIDSVNYGVDKLTDANWTWDKYWSSNRLPVELLVEVNEEILLSKKLESLVLTSVNENDLPSSLSIWEVDKNNVRTLLVSDIVVQEHQITGYNYRVGDYNSFTSVVKLDLKVSSNKLIFEFLDSEGGLIRLRELDLHFQRPTLLEDVKTFYPFS